MMRHTLNGLTPRTERDTARDPFDWADARILSALFGTNTDKAPSVIPLDSSIAARLARWLRWWADRIKASV